jgi:hypothetical protein
VTKENKSRTNQKTKRFLKTFRNFVAKNSEMNEENAVFSNIFPKMKASTTGMLTDQHQERIIAFKVGPSTKYFCLGQKTKNK